ncbi:hypothetical protein JL722_9107 [Aureococcus anophagefferens]|nr:hypothetical protein JL722_9107 [Aureococcus anophagefferens]
MATMKEVIAAKGATVRDGVELDSASAGWSAPFGAVVEVLEEASTASGVARCRVGHGGRAGWVSAKVLRAPTASGESTAARLKAAADELNRAERWPEAVDMLALDRGCAELRDWLQELRDADGFAVDASLTPDDAALADDAAKAAHKAKGAELFAAAKWAKAAAAFTKALAADATDGVLYSNRSACHAKLDAFAAALRDADACVALKPTWAKAASRRGAALFGLGRYEAAAAACRDGLAATDGATPATAAALEELLENATARSSTSAAPAGLWVADERGGMRKADLGSLCATSGVGTLGGLDAVLRDAASGNPASEKDMRAEARAAAAREGGGR